MCQAVQVLIGAVACVLAAATWVYLAAARGGYWRTDQRLPPAGPEPARWPSVVAVVPARDEAALLPGTLPTLLAQAYPGAFRVIVVDDDSSDGTAAAAAAAGRACVAGAHAGLPARALRIISGRPTPPGWAGKPWAMAQGLAAAGQAEFVLFTDADIAYAPGTLAAVVRAALAGQRVLVSQMALLRAETFWERQLVPAFVYFFAQLYPFRWVNRPQRRTAAAAGGCMLVRRQALAEAGGLERIRGARIDDVALGRLLKAGRHGAGRHGAGCWLGLSTAVVSRRGYPGLAEVWDMVARSAYTQLRYSPSAVALTVAGLAWLYLLPPVAALTGAVAAAAHGGLGPAAAWAAAAGAAGWAIMSVTYLPLLRLYRLSPARAPLLPLIAALYAGMTVDSALRHHRGQGGQWKGRHVPARRPR